MSEFRERTTGEVKSQVEWRLSFPNMSLPKVWSDSVCDALNIDPVLPSPAATTTAYQTSVRDGVEQDSDGNWIEKHVARDMFSADSDGTKKEKETAYQATLDEMAASAARAKRDQLLTESDWVTIRAKELGQTVPEAWYTYRGDLRQIPEQEGFPNNITWPTKPE